ncbi:MAG: DUF5018 domain-containing protein, partial [Treponema sp.]|nr:DUF5018 domain-containing protein [Treponema sp.]
MKISHNRFYVGLTFLLFLAAGFTIPGCEFFSNSMVDYFLDNTGTVEVTGISGKTQYARMANGIIFIPPSDDITIIDVALSNPRNFTIRQEIRGVPPGKNISARQTGPTGIEVAIAGAVLGDEYDLTLAMQSPDGLRDFEPYPLKIQCVSFETALLDCWVDDEHPLLNSGGSSFMVKVPYSTETIDLGGTTLDSGARLVIKDVSGTVLAEALHRAEAAAQPLNPGDNIFYFEVISPSTSVKSYTITVSRGLSPSEKAITAFAITGPVSAAGIVAEAAHAITVSVPYGTAVTAMTAAVSHTGVSIDPDPAAATDYSAPVTYTVRAADGTTQTYTVTVTVSSSYDKEITAFAITGPVSAGGTVDEDARTITVSVPYGTAVTAMT